MKTKSPHDVFAERLNQIAERARAEIEDAIKIAEASNVDVRGSSALWARYADTLAELGAFLRDWAGGPTGLRAQKYRRGVRKALGYTYP